MNVECYKFIKIQIKGDISSSVRALLLNIPESLVRLNVN
jgi:hypothetical protein